ncbi:HipA domain-containing protein [Pseudomonas chlororaphis subsp. aurantiaca]|uniref:HipA domain-containing protein n=1 Tax=Pseudomonas chlororaphis TaxID=587753 RepID=UPI0027DB09AD|nr:HipA domain-containing protein [Pseudomonas chlororaphis]WMJ01363.1 HipA domain-containing protein [Pseudomonas chlororaphis subsp. aurantiaca]
MFDVIEVQQDWVVDEEWMGTKTKFWVTIPPNGDVWLFKHSRRSGMGYAGEHWSEKLASEIAKVIGVSCADVELATFNRQPGCLSRRFAQLSDSVELVHGNELLAGAITGYDQAKNYGLSTHTLENILYTVSLLMPTQEARVEAAVALGGMITLDALIVNVDRHHENWCVFRTREPDGVKHSIGPSFDHASSLGRELSPAKIDSWLRSGLANRGEWYVNKARGAIYWNSSGSKGTNPLELLRLAHGVWPEMITPWLERLAGIEIDELCRLLDEIPDDCIEQSCREFTSDLLRYTYRELTGIR